MQSALNRPLLSSDGITSRDLAWALTQLGSAAKRALRRAHDEAYHRQNDHISSLHLLLALMAERSDPVVRALQSRTNGLSALTAAVEEAQGPQRTPRFIHLVYAPNAKSIVFHAARRSKAVGSTDTTPAHMWWALSRHPHSRAGALLFHFDQLDYVERLTQKPF
ncbi:Clp protease N-terminal domain-containing protein [Mycobacterium sp. MS1601]|uniref:Clp protease N-terminal domain-containing protein n=1 Tax=Mycobacterium sp. MS1601 TaxID=1936029 RepID=UPI00178CF643|nr:Clp protease N-terminal domain-containing protein [Mycobacterium sp. MS1601]